MPILILLLFLALPGLAQEAHYDNLTVLGASPTLTDEEDSSLTIYAMQTKYKEPVVGMYFANGDSKVRFYMNRVTWDKLKKDLTKAKTQWTTLTAREFEMSGQAVEGYKIANKLATLRVSLVGETDLAHKRLMLSASGGAETTVHVDIALQQKHLEELVADFQKVDQFFATGGK